MPEWFLKLIIVSVTNKFISVLIVIDLSTCRIKFINYKKIEKSFIEAYLYQLVHPVTSTVVL